MRNPWLCILIVASLGTSTLSCIGGIIVLSAYGRPIPDTLTAVASACIGALSSFLVLPPRGSVGTGDEPRILKP